MVNEGGRRETSEFNDALGFLGRMNILFMGCIRSRMDTDAYSWFNCLLAMNAELWDDMSKPERDESMTKRQGLSPLMSKHHKTLSNIGMVAIEPTLHDALDDYERFLRDIYRKSGYKTKMADDPRFAR